MTIRKLKAKDLFSLARTIRKIGIGEEIKEIMMESNSVKDIYSRGYDIMERLFSKIIEKNSEDEIFSFFANITECEKEEMADMDPVDFIDMILEIADVKKWKDFLERASKLMK